MLSKDSCQSIVPRLLRVLGNCCRIEVSVGGEGELGFELLVEAHKLLDGGGHDEGNKNVPYNLVFLTTHLYLVRDLILLHVS